MAQSKSCNSLFQCVSIKPIPLLPGNAAVFSGAAIRTSALIQSDHSRWPKCSDRGGSWRPEAVGYFLDRPDTGSVQATRSRTESIMAGHTSMSYAGPLPASFSAALCLAQIPPLAAYGYDFNRWRQRAVAARTLLSELPGEHLIDTQLAATDEQQRNEHGEEQQRYAVVAEAFVGDGVAFPELGEA